MALSSKDYEAIAEIFAKHALNNDEFIWLLEEVARDLSSYMAADNPAFDRMRFMYACGV